MSPVREIRAFVSYRRADGELTARRVHRDLHGRHVALRSQPHSGVLSVFLDYRAPAVPDWPVHHRRHLSASDVLIVVVSPGARAIVADDADWLDEELLWWLEHRADSPPILVASELPRPERWIPSRISSKWPDSQVIQVEADDDLSGSPRDESAPRHIESIIEAVRFRLSDWTPSTAELGLDDQPFHYAWSKDRNLRYLACNDNYAQAAGFDSPGAMIGKTDHDMPWSSLADLFQTGDRQLMKGEGHRLFVQEREIMVNRVADILVVETPMLTGDGRCVGVQGYFIDVTGKQVHWNLPADESYGGDIAVDGVPLSRSESLAVLGALGRHPNALTAASLGLSEPELKSMIRRVMYKAGCTTTGDLLDWAITTALPDTALGLAVCPDPEPAHA